MCFETTKSARAKIAKKDIECWKIISHEPDGTYRSYRDWLGVIPVQYIMNVKSVVVKLHLICNSFSENAKIENGYHSFRSFEFAVEYRERFSWNSGMIYKFIIPSGTRYFDNETQYVSETIMMVE